MTAVDNFPNPDAPKKKSLLKKIKWSKIFGLLKIKVPLGLVLVVLIALGVYSLMNTFSSSDETTLGDSVKDARSLRVNITMCNERVDELGLDVREEELRLKKNFEENEGVKNARFNIARINCDEETQTNVESENLSDQ